MIVSQYIAGSNSKASMKDFKQERARFNFDPGHKCFYMGHVSDNPLWVRVLMLQTHHHAKEFMHYQEVWAHI